MCVAERAAADHSSSARRRADELLEGGAPRTSSRTSAQALARSGPGRRVSGSARRGGGDARRSAIGACGACGSCRNAPRTGLCGWIGGCARAGIVSGVRTARPERASRRGAAPEEHVSVTLETDGSCTIYWYNEPYRLQSTRVAEAAGGFAFGGAATRARCQCSQVTLFELSKHEGDASSFEDRAIANRTTGTAVRFRFLNTS